MSSHVREASLLLKQLAGTRDATEKTKGVIGRVSDELGWPYARTRNIWYEQSRRVDPAELDALRAATRKYKAAVNNLLALRYALAAKDPAFHRHDVSAIDFALRRLGCHVGTADLGNPEE